MSKKGECTVLKKGLPNIILKKKNMIQPNTLYKEDIVYQSHYGDFLRLKDPSERITIYNRLNLSTLRSHTVAQLTSSNKVVWEKTSEQITSVIGQENYDLVFSSLCSVISQEFKIRSILALMTEPRKQEKQSQFSQSDLSEIKVTVDKEVQTVEGCLNIIKKQTRRAKRQVVPYVVTDDKPEEVSKLVVHPDNFECFMQASVSVKSENENMDGSQISFLNGEQDSEHLSFLKCDNNSRDSCGNFSIVTTDELMNAPLSLVDQMTEPSNNCTSLVMLDGTVINIPCKIEDDFHVATPEILKVVPPEHRRKLLWYQAYTDWKYCLTRDDDDNLPIHLAVLNDDVHLLRRQCLVLKTRQESVDITNGDNLTALQMSILASSPLCTALLIQLGANPLVTDDEYRTCFHLAAEAGAPHLEALIGKCEEDPLSILRRSDELWKPEVALKPKDYQVKYLLHRVCTMFDSQGYTPLMLASKLGKHDAVLALVKAAPSSVDYKATSSGATALYIAVGAACTDSSQRGNKSKVFDDFKKTIEYLVEAGADPDIDNYSGSDVYALLTEHNNSELSMMIASKRTAINCNNIDSIDTKPFMIVKDSEGRLMNIKDQTKKVKGDTKPFIIVKDSDGTLMNIEDQNKKVKEINKIKQEIKKEVASKGKKKNKPIILENKVITPAEDYMSSYKKFVTNMNAFVDPKVCNVKIKNDSKPSTSKYGQSNEIDKTDEIKVEINTDCSNDLANETEINDEGFIEIKTENIEITATNVDEKNGNPIRVGKRKIVVKKGGTPIILSSVSTPKKKKTNDDNISEKT